MRRLTLFAGYNYNGKISQYVVNYIKELSTYSDILYLADGKTEDIELDKIKKYCISVQSRNHRKYDFGSYSILFSFALKTGLLEKYEEIILANDSCICVNSFSQVFSHFDKNPELDAWALLSSDDSNVTKVIPFSDYWKRPTISSSFALCSFFLVLRKNVINDNGIQKFLLTCNEFTDRGNVCLYYEMPLTQLIHNKGYKAETYVKNIYRFSSSYSLEAFNLIKKGFPLLKIRLFTDNIGGCPFVNELLEASENYCDYSPIDRVKEIRLERNVNLPIEKTKIPQSKLRKMFFYAAPPILWETLKLWKNFYIQRNGIINKISILIPPAFSFIKNSLIYLFTKKNCKNKYTFILKPMAPFKGFYPQHIYNYENIQSKKASKYSRIGELIIFFNVSRDQISGGMLSINRFSMKIKEKYPEIAVLQSGLPLSNAVINNSYFDYGTDLIDFHYIVKHTKPNKLLINIPECFSSSFLQELDADSLKWLWEIKDFRINILNQSDILMPPGSVIENLRTLCNGKLTITAAHKRYCTTEKSRQYRSPVFLLTPFLPIFYFTDFKDKQKMILFSPDVHPYRDKILNKLRTELPDFKLLEINNLTLEEYKHKITKAMFVISFGEGYDGYFIEPLLSGSVSFAVRNPVFFPKNFQELPTVYNSYDEMLVKISHDIQRLFSDENFYKRCVNIAKTEVRKFTNDEIAWANLSDFVSRFKKNMDPY